MTSSNDILDEITRHKRLWQLLLTAVLLLLNLVPNIDVNIILDLNGHRSLNINEKIILEN